MTRSIGLAVLSGLAMVAFLSTFPRLGSRSRARRLAPHLRPATAGTTARGDGEAAIAALGAAATSLLQRVAGKFDPLDVRLHRVHRHGDAAAFRFRQGAAVLTGSMAGAAFAALTEPPPTITLVALAGGATVGALVPELTLINDGHRWSRRVQVEMPVVGEQLVALLRAGRSPVAALSAVADGDDTPARRDIGRVVEGVRRGSALVPALRRWSATSDVDAVGRLGAVLALHLRTPDLAGLVEREVDTIRAELHRQLLAQIDRRAQQIWIPVTVAALIPGAVFLLIPFFDALRLLGGA